MLGLPPLKTKLRSSKIRVACKEKAKLAATKGEVCACPHADAATSAIAFTQGPFIPSITRLAAPVRRRIEWEPYTFPESTNIVDIVDITTIEPLSAQRPGATAEGPTDERQSEKKRRITSQPLYAQFASSKLTADMESLMADSSRAGRTSQFRG
ncbi:hypothetical protein N656DRAFT_361202 [Canariomyces notabilis]|uniref:Uncharacterized protein n=1 Tax=Canariomyces notabilis TaxID=2074819 RepID=A0AAN6T8Z2_9PEZI|nr:hypothetical protein N656DRAFT_361202 [Canariomyces arenarius]